MSDSDSVPWIKCACGVKVNKQGLESHLRNSTSHRTQALQLRPDNTIPTPQQTPTGPAKVKCTCGAEVCKQGLETHIRDSRSHRIQAGELHPGNIIPTLQQNPTISAGAPRGSTDQLQQDVDVKNLKCGCGRFFSSLTGLRSHRKTSKKCGEKGDAGSKDKVLNQANVNVNTMISEHSHEDSGEETAEQVQRTGSERRVKYEVVTNGPLGFVENPSDGLAGENIFADDTYFEDEEEDEDYWESLESPGQKQGLGLHQALDYSVCDKDCGWCGHCMEGADWTE